MNRSEQLQYLNQILLTEMPQYREQAEAFPADDTSQRRLLRSLMNVRPPLPLPAGFLNVQDALLSAEREEKGVVDGNTLPSVPSDPRLIIWQGDITRLRVDAIVDADNSSLLGCFVPCHGCIDNCIHTYSGIQLRLACGRIMEEQGHEEPTGKAKITPAFNLPSDHVIHTVGPIVYGPLTQTHCRLLADCYRSCLETASEKGLKSIAFCCISTGEFHFPQEKTARIAVETVREFLQKESSIRQVVFNVFKKEDYEIYKGILG